MRLTFLKKLLQTEFCKRLNKLAHFKFFGLGSRIPGVIWKNRI